MRTASAPPPQTIDEYLATAGEDKLLALEKLRAAIQSAAPNAVECISYGVPGVRLEGKLLVSFGAATKHCAFYPGAHPLVACAAELKGYDMSKGTIRFPAEKPLPVALVKKIVKARMEQYAALKVGKVKGGKAKKSGQAKKR